MSDINKQALPNSLEIIERFGGIRPMATKLDVPVTTVQGWKKREAIPVNRKDEIIAAAEKHDVEVADLLTEKDAAPKQAQPTPERPTQPTAPASETPKAAAPKVEAPKTETPRPQPINPRLSPAQQENVINPQNAAQQARSTQSLINGIVGGVSIAALAGVLGLLFLTGPKVKQTDKQEQKIAELEEKLAEMSQKQSVFQKIVPQDLDKKIGEIKELTKKHTTPQIARLREMKSTLKTCLELPVYGYNSSRYDMKILLRLIIKVLDKSDEDSSMSLLKKG
ncbi:MAG: hypothetical protein VX740_09125, partial [Pseudomonadota bacterium]|nr:hypothetical protein [Pseudomonadota bacterium]